MFDIMRQSRDWMLEAPKNWTTNLWAWKIIVPLLKCYYQTAIVPLLKCYYQTAICLNNSFIPPYSIKYLFNFSLGNKFASFWVAKSIISAVPNLIQDSLQASSKCGFTKLQGRLLVHACCSGDLKLWVCPWCKLDSWAGFHVTMFPIHWWVTVILCVWLSLTPRRLGTRLCMTLCLSVTTLAATYLIYTSQVRCHRVVYGVFKILVVWLLLKMLCSKVLVWFSDHHCLPGFSVMMMTSSWCTRETD